MSKPVLRSRNGTRAALNGKAHNGTAVNGKHRNGKLVVVKQNGKAAKLNGLCGHATVPTPKKLGRVKVNEQEKIDSNGSQTLTVSSVNGAGISVNSRRKSALVLRDGLLIDRCLSGDVSAWSEIYREFHDSLLVSIRRYLNRAGQDINVVEEIAARVWYALIKNGFELLARFDVSRGCRLSTYLSIVAKNETRVLFRSERRRRSREQLASRPDITDESRLETTQLASDDEFLVTLSQAEQAYFMDVLVAAPAEREAAEQNYSIENNWQLRHRIRKKLEQYISESDSE